MDSFKLLTKMGRSKRRKLLPWTLLVAAPLCGFAGSFVVLGVFNASAIAALAATNAMVVVFLLIRGLAARVGLLETHDTIIFELSGKARYFEERNADGFRVPAYLFVARDDEYWKFVGHRPKYGKRMAVKSVKEAGDASRPPGYEKRNPSDFQYIAPTRRE